MKFTTLIPTTWNDGTAIEPALLSRVIDGLWRPFRGMSEERFVTGHWIDDDGAEFTDQCVRVSIECDRGSDRCTSKSPATTACSFFGSSGRTRANNEVRKMTAKARQNARVPITVRAQRVLAFAEQHAARVADWLELHFALYGVDGQATKLFPTERERAAFMRTAAYRRILSLMNALPRRRKKRA
jgi:hypothetical protein